MLKKYLVLQITNQIDHCLKKVLNHDKQSATDALDTTSGKVIQKTAEVTVDLIDNKIADRNTKVLKFLQQNNSETVTNEHFTEILKERYISPEERQNVIDYQRLI